MRPGSFGEGWDDGELEILHQPPHPVEKAPAAFDGVVGPFQLLFRRRGKEDKQARRVGADTWR